MKYLTLHAVFPSINASSISCEFWCKINRFIMSPAFYLERVNEKITVSLAD